MGIKEFLAGTPFCIRSKKGIFQYSETLMGGELIYCNGTSRIIYPVQEISETGFSYTVFDTDKMVEFKNCITSEETKKSITRTLINKKGEVRYTSI